MSHRVVSEISHGAATLDDSGLNILREGDNIARLIEPHIKTNPRLEQ